MSTIDDSFEVQAPKSSYTRLTLGTHHIRILGPSVSGWEYWEDLPDGGRKPIRSKTTDPLPVEHAEDVKKFLAFPIWSYDQKRIQIFEITQVTIQRELLALERNKKWGDLMEYDLEIERTGNDKNNTKYAVRPEPKTELDEEIVKAVAENGLPELEALFVGADPFNYSKIATETLEEVDTEKLPF